MAFLGPRYLLVNFLSRHGLMRIFLCLRFWLIHHSKKETVYPSQRPDQNPNPNGASCESRGNRVPLSWQVSVGATRNTAFAIACPRLEVN